MGCRPRTGRVVTGHAARMQLSDHLKDAPGWSGRVVTGHAVRMWLTDHSRDEPGMCGTVVQAALQGEGSSSTLPWLPFAKLT